MHVKRYGQGERIFFGLVEQLMAELNAEMEKNIRQFMALHVR